MLYKFSVFQDILFTWMADNKTSKWSEGLWFVQCSKNRRIHQGIGRSPYEAMYGKRMEIGISALPIQSLDCIQTEDDLEAALAGEQSQERVNAQTAIEDNAPFPCPKEDQRIIDISPTKGDNR